MSKEEALKLWLPIIAMGVENMPECKEALDMAIKALEKEQETEIRRKARVTAQESCYLEQGITQGVV